MAAPLRPPRTARSIRLRALAGATVVVVGSLVAACGGGSSSGSPDTTSTTAPSDLQYAAHADPAKPIEVEAGHRFAVILPADPGSGWRWVMAPIDTAIVIPLGSEFRDDPSLLSQTVSAVTTTTVDPAVTTTRPTSTSTTDASSTSTEADVSSTTTGRTLPLVQVLSFAGRAAGTTTISFRYERIGETTASPIVVTFTVVVSPLRPTTTTH